jgi:hypothetical protein
MDAQPGLPQHRHTTLFIGKDLKKLLNLCPLAFDTSIEFSCGNLWRVAKRRESGKRWNKAGASPSPLWSGTAGFATNTGVVLAKAQETTALDRPKVAID